MIFFSGFATSSAYTVSSTIVSTTSSLFSSISSTSTSIFPSQPVPDSWSDWTEWSDCTQHCGENGERTREKTCLEGECKVPPEETEEGFQFLPENKYSISYYMKKISIGHIFNPNRRPVIFASVLIILHGASGAAAQ